MPATPAPRYVSPLRYPGGKARMARYLRQLLTAQAHTDDVQVWIEPFAGGLGAGLTLLAADEIEELWFAETHPALAAMWRAIVTDPHAFAAAVATSDVDVDLYRHCVQQITHATTVDADELSDLEVGLAAFIVNRCSRSGIVAAGVGPVGGWAQQGQWTITSRFDRDRLAERIGALAPLTSRMRYLPGGAHTAIADLAGSGIEDEVFLFVDPPYVREGNRLYTNGMSQQQHQALADELNASPARWVLTYDDEPVVARQWYRDRRVLEFDIPNSANRARIAREFLVIGQHVNLTVGTPAPLPKGGVQWLRAHDTSHPRLPLTG